LLFEETIPSINEKFDDLKTSIKDEEILKKIDTMEQIMVRKNEETLNKINDIEKQVQIMSQNQEGRQQTEVRKSNSFDG
jgi:CHASE3 domain sensor protein